MGDIEIYGEICDFILLEHQCNHLAIKHSDSAAEAVWSNFMVLFFFWRLICHTAALPYCLC